MRRTLMGADVELWQAYRRTRDLALRERIIEKHLVLVKYTAARLAGRLPSHLRFEDLYSAGLLGYLRAVEDYDPDRGVEFRVYATQRIRGSIFDELRRLDWVPRAVRRKIRDAERAIDTLFRRLGHQPTEEEISSELSIGLEDYRRLLGYGLTLLSLDAPAGGQEEGLSPLDSLEDGNSPNPFLSLAAKERRAILGRIIEGLPERERHVLSLYYYEELTMQEVGQALGVTESRVSQLHSSAILRIRSALRRYRISATDLVLGHGGRR
jgi:RNA polymerase sigma factor for flagellar operon FliA